MQHFVSLIFAYLPWYFNFKSFISDTPSMNEFGEGHNPNEKPIIWTDYYRINSTHFKSNSLDAAIGVFPDIPVVLSDLRNMWALIFT